MKNDIKKKLYFKPKFLVNYQVLNPESMLIQCALIHEEKWYEDLCYVTAEVQDNC